MLKLVSEERDARSERQSSWLSSRSRAGQRLFGLARPLQLGFAGFVLLHFAGQAYRASTDGPLPEPGFERAPWFVAALHLLFWLPFTLVALSQLARSFEQRGSSVLQGQERALSALDPLALAIVVLFGSVHGTLMTWPLLSGSLDAADLRAELVADLSGTWHGVPLEAIVYLCAVGAAAFYAARLTLALLRVKRPTLSRGVLGLAVLGYVLGSYAVIRCASGSLLP
jgi:hypothetical protein